MSDQYLNEINVHIEELYNINDILYNYINDESHEEEEEEENAKRVEKTINSLFTYSNSKFKENKYYFKELLYIISNISLNHHRCPSFIDKIEKILFEMKDNMKNFFTNSEIFQIFRKNKRILLFLFEQSIIIPDEILARIITSDKYSKYKYPEYFFPEFQSFFDENNKRNILSKISSIKNYEEKRRIGENDNYLCDIIRKDLIDDFIIFIHQTNCPLTIKIKQSIFETNPVFIKETPTIIEYAMFHGSIRIIKYLLLNNISITSKCIFKYNSFRKC